MQSHVSESVDNKGFLLTLRVSHEYYPVFRCIFFISFFFSLYGANLFIWRRVKIDYAGVLGVSYAHTYRTNPSPLPLPPRSPLLLYYINYLLCVRMSVSSVGTEYVLRGSTSVAYIVFSMFMLYVLTLTGELEILKLDYIKHVFPMMAFLLPLLIFFCPWDALTHVRRRLHTHNTTS